MKRATEFNLAFLGFSCLLWIVGAGNALIGQEPSAENRAIEKPTNRSLLETIRDEADSVEYFSLPTFLESYKEDLGLYEYPRGIRRDLRVVLPVTFDRFAPFDAIYEVAKRATRSEINECLAAFDNLSAKERAFVLASATLYLYRSENPALVQATPERERVEPLSDEEKSAFFDRVPRDGVQNSETAFERLEGDREEWSASFREGALALQSSFGKRNPYCPLSPRTEETWRQVCDEAPIVLLYSVLAMETRLDFDAVNSSAGGSSASHAQDSIANPLDEDALGKINAMKHYLRLQGALALRRPSVGNPSAAPPQPQTTDYLGSQSLSDIAKQARVFALRAKNEGVPEFFERN